VDPQQLKFSSSHEWVHLAETGGQRLATVGISAFAIELLTDLVHMELPPVGRKTQPGESVGEIESVKAVSDIYSPVEGEVVEVNSALANSLENMADDPYGKSWIVKIRLTSERGLDQLMDYAAYQAQCAKQG